MGSYGSTRWNHERTRQSTDGLLSLDVRSLKRAGCLRPGAVHSWRWTRGRDGELAGDIVLRMDRAGDCLTLDYRTRRYGETEWTRHTQPVWLETTPCHYGGERVWFACPGCQSRRAVLFSAGGVFRCRVCHDLAYTSTREDEIERANRRIVTLQRKLKAPAGCDLFHVPIRPVGMHSATYERLVSELMTEHRRRDALFGAALEALLSRSERLLSERGG
jgi:hypothetical protein